MRRFLGGFVLGCAAGALAVAALGPCGAAATDAPVTESGTQAVVAEARDRSGARAATESAVSGARAETSIGEAASDEAAGTRPSVAAARAGSAAASRRGAPRAERPAPLPETGGGSAGQWAGRVRVSGAATASVTSSIVSNFDWAVEAFANDEAESAWVVQAMTFQPSATRADVLGALAQLSWSSRIAPWDRLGGGDATSLLALCRAAAAAHVAADGDTSDAAIRRLLASGDAGSAEIAIGLADGRPLPDVLAAAVRDASLGSLRLAAGASIVERCADDDVAAAALIAMARDDDAVLRSFASATLSRLGARGADAAADRLIAGDFFLGDLAALAPAAMQSARRVEVLTALRDPVAILACCSALRGGEFGSSELAPVARQLPGILDPVFLSAEGAEMIGFAADVLAGAAPDALVAIATSARYPSASRMTALDRACRHAGSPDATIDRAARILQSADLTPDLLAAARKWIPDDAATSPRFADLWRGLAERSRDPWTREASRRQYQACLPGDARGVVIDAAVYGHESRTVDVAAALRARLALGTLVETAGNHLGGDPAFGITKTLHVEGSAGGRRFVRDVREGSLLRLP